MAANDTEAARAHVAAPPDQDQAKLDQERLFQELTASGALGDGSVERIDTPISTIFLCGDRAFKAMRCVQLRFVDFSTRDLRRTACQAEVAANPAAPDLYLRARPILRQNDRLTLGDPASAQEAEDWLVEMRRFDRGNEFDALLDRGALTTPAIERLADIVADAHLGSAERRRGDASFIIRQTTENAIATLGETARAPELVRLVETWATRIRPEYERRSPQLDARGRHGRVRRCHGDLHLGNIVMIGDRPTPFDAIVFNPSLTDIDIGYDTAFAAMDLAARGAPDLANAFLGRWLSATRDYSGLSLMPIFVSLRAAIRGMVAALRGDEARAIERMTVAVDALRAGAPAMLAIGGGSGAGKTTLARQLAPHFAGGGDRYAGIGAVHLRSDVTRKRLLGLAPEAPAPASAYAAEVSERMLTRMRRDAGAALRAGASVVWDMTFLRHDHRAAAADVAAHAGVAFAGLWLETDSDICAARADARQTRARSDKGLRDASDADAAIARRQQADPITEPGWIRLDATMDPERVRGAAMAGLGSFLEKKQTAAK